MASMRLLATIAPGSTPILQPMVEQFTATRFTPANRTISDVTAENLAVSSQLPRTQDIVIYFSIHILILFYLILFYNFYVLIWLFICFYNCSLL
jgi:hypothetical protein